MALQKEELTEAILHLEIRKTVLRIIAAVLLHHPEVAIRAEAVVHALLIVAVVVVPVHLVAVEVAAVAVEDKHEQQKN